MPFVTVYFAGLLCVQLIMTCTYYMLTSMLKVCSVPVMTLTDGLVNVNLASMLYMHVNIPQACQQGSKSAGFHIAVQARLCCDSQGSHNCHLDVHTLPATKMQLQTVLHATCIV